MVAGEFGREPDGTPGPAYEPGMELHGKYVLLAEGVRGSLAKQVMARFELSKGHEPQKFGLGMKEIWEIDPAKHRPGTVTHTMGWPLGGNAGGGSFIYHLDNNQVYVGFVVHLNYANPYLYPYMEFQRFKHHPMVAELLEGGKRVAYGARAISEGGWQSIPEDGVPRRRAAGLLGRAGQRAADQGQPQRDAVGHRGGRGGGCGDPGRAVGRRADDYDSALRAGPIGQRPAPGAQRQADVVAMGAGRPRWSLGGFDMWTNNLFGLSLFGTLQARQVRCRGDRQGEGFQADRLSRSPTAS